MASAMNRIILFIGAFLGLSGVIAGALFDHALSEKATHITKTALSYHQSYAMIITVIGLLLVYGHITDKARRHLVRSAMLFIVGTFIFCMSLYCFALTGLSLFSYGAPFGGITLMGGWVSLAVSTAFPSQNLLLRQ